MVITRFTPCYIIEAVDNKRIRTLIRQLGESEFEGFAHRESALMEAIGLTAPESLASMDQISSFVSSEKPSSTAPALVPAAIKGRATLDDQANVAVRGISRSRPIVVWKAGYD